MVEPVWKIISVFLALAAFLVVGGMSLHSGQELIWVAGKAVASFVVCWIVLSQLGVILFAVIGNSEDLGSDTDKIVESEN